ncbi:MAG: methyltransferase domain-containing protein [Rhodoferax sp.]|nr:methyltransferase domain-containing protein [Rhodoferax sp.]
MKIKHDVLQHYRAPDLLARIESALLNAGKSRAEVGIDDLAPADEFHLRGPLATGELIELLEVVPGMHVLDAGSGLGGPARRLAHATGCKVTGIDLSEDYACAGTVLNQWTRLDKQVDFVVGDATDLGRFQANSFDAAWTIHASMNIPDKSRFYSEIARVLKPGARFVAYDVLTTGSQDLHFPVPWASGRSASFLQTTDDMQAVLRLTGFQQFAHRDCTAECIRFLEQAQQQIAQQELPTLGLHLLFGPRFRDMIANLARNFADGRATAAVVTCTNAA